ncbi:sugar ABC transporter permease [Acholeplasma sp. OttesenSCG-928-E16]|nr:sugar ABC transporter permease [Acholeplasma sp. OttesenSCG-928-E16]
MEVSEKNVLQVILLKIGRAFKNFFIKIAKSLKKVFVDFGFRFKDSSIWTKISHFILGFGNFARKQFVKGSLFLVSEVIFLLIMIISPEISGTPIGGKALGNLTTLGTNVGSIFEKADNSLLMLLYGIVTIMLILIFFRIWIGGIKSSYKADLDIRNGERPTNFIEDVKTLADEKFHTSMLTPAVIGILVLTIIPNIFMIFVAFTNYDNDHLPPNQLFDWVGFVNFAGLFNGSSDLFGFWGVLGWTLIWAVCATFTNYFLGIFVAILINNKLVKFKKMWRTIFVLTIAIPQFVSLLMMRLLFSEYGPINTALKDWGLIDTPIKFLGNADNMWLARLMVIIINIWVGIPYTMLMTSGILMNVPAELYEAAEMDGAKKSQQFRKITMPYILFITTPYLISSFMGNITSFNIIYLLTAGGPNTSAGPKPGDTDLLVTWLFRLTVDQNNYSTGAVISILTFIIMAVGTLATYRNTKSYKEEGEFQ